MPEKRTDDLSDATRRQSGDIQERPIENRQTPQMGEDRVGRNCCVGCFPLPMKLLRKGKSSVETDVSAEKLRSWFSSGHPPEKLVDHNLYSADCVVAAFDCKTTLSIGHIVEAMKACTEIKGLYPSRIGTPYRELHAPIIYGVLARSYSWKGEGRMPESDIEKMLSASDGAVRPTSS